MTRCFTVLCIIAASGTQPLAAQVRLSGGVTVNQVRVRSDASGVMERMSAAGLGLELAARRGIVRLELEYLQANLSPGDPLVLRRDMSEAAIFLGIEPLDWLHLATGVHRRHFETDAGEQRWTMWEVRVRAQRALLATLADGYVELRPVLAAANVPGDWGSGFGGEAGVTARPPGLPFAVRLGYRIERYSLDSGGRTETTDGIVLSIVTGLP